MNKIIIGILVFCFAISSFAYDREIKLNREYTAVIFACEVTKFIDDFVSILHNNHEFSWLFSFPQDYKSNRAFTGKISSSNLTNNHQELSVFLYMISPYIEAVMFDVDNWWQTLKIELFFFNSDNPVKITLALKPN